MTFITKLIALLILSLFLSVTNEAQLSAEEAPSLTELSGENIDGSWRFNESQSDDLLEVLQSLFQKVSAKNSLRRPAQSTTYISPPISFSLNAPDRLVIVTDTDNKSITINERFTRSISSRTFLNDGKKHFIKVQEAARSVVSTIRIGDFVRIETISPRANKMTEVYEVADNGRKLIVTFTFEDEKKQEIFSLHRIYDRALLNPSQIESEEME